MRAASVALLLLVATASAGQEFDIYDPNDFIDPRARGVVFTPGRFGVVEKGMNFTLTRIYTGRVYDYQWRNDSTNVDLRFLHLTTSHYRGDRQFTLKLTGFDPDGEARVPHFRATVQAGQYFLSPNADEEKRIAGRLLVLWSVERNPWEGEGAGQERFNQEFGIESDVRVPLPRPIGSLESFDGSFIWMRRRVAEREWVDRVSYLYRLRERRRSNGRLQLNAAIGGGAERSDGWHCCLLRGVFTATFVIPRVNVGVNAAFAPTYSPAAEGRRTHREFALYLDRTLIARLADVMK